MKKTANRKSQRTQCSVDSFQWTRPTKPAVYPIWDQPPSSHHVPPSVPTDNSGYQCGYQLLLAAAGPTKSKRDARGWARVSGASWRIGWRRRERSRYQGWNRPRLWICWNQSGPAEAQSALRSSSPIGWGPITRACAGEPRWTSRQPPISLVSSLFQESCASHSGNNRQKKE